MRNSFKKKSYIFICTCRCLISAIMAGALAQGEEGG
jgi:hypothetical protein